MALPAEDLAQHVFFDVLDLLDQFIDQNTCVHRVPHSFGGKRRGFDPVIECGGDGASGARSP